MPEVNFRVRWPDQSQTLCYSPSSTIRDAFVVGKAYAVDEFLQISRDALTLASQRVEQKYGYFCSSAMQQLDQIERRAAEFADDTKASITVESFE
jgi:uncharacterized repeat protein (TIGR04042 family)